MNCNGKPSAAEYRKGCRCEGCKTALAEYMAAYRKHKVIVVEAEGGGQKYHSHKGRPSRTGALHFGCTHPTCLALAGLHADENGVVLGSDNAAAPAWFTDVPDQAV